MKSNSINKDKEQRNPFEIKRKEIKYIHTQDLVLLGTPGSVFSKTDLPPETIHYG